MKSKIVTLQIFIAVLCSFQVLQAQDKIKDICVLHPSPLSSNSASSGITWTVNSTPSTQLVTIHNPTNKAIKLGKIFIDGTDANQFALQNKTPILGKNQRAEDCSNTTLNANGSCSFRVASLFNSPAGPCTIHVPGGGPCDLKISVQKTTVN